VFFVVDIAVRIIEAKPKRFFKGDVTKALFGEWFPEQMVVVEVGFLMLGLI